MKIQSLATHSEAFFEMMYNFKEGTTFQNFVNIVELKSKNIKVSTEGISDAAEANRLLRECEKQRSKFKGDCFEIFAELFFNAFENDPSVGLIDYTPIDSENDYGVDAVGRNANNDRVAVQIKYRTNPTDSITYSDLAKTYTSARRLENIDVDCNNSMFVFTTAYDVTNPCVKLFGPTLVVINFNVIDRYVTNNKSFWRNSFERVFNHLN